MTDELDPHPHHVGTQLFLHGAVVALLREPGIDHAAAVV